MVLANPIHTPCPGRCPSPFSLTVYCLLELLSKALHLLACGWKVRWGAYDKRRATTASKGRK